MTFNTYDPFRQINPSAKGLAYDVVRSEEGVVLSVDIPGIDPSTVDVTVEGRSLTLEATRPSSVPEGARVVSRNTRSGNVSQTFQIGARLDADNLSADYNFGVLTITIPLAESAKPRKVEVGVGAAPAIDAASEDA